MGQEEVARSRGSLVVGYWLLIGALFGLSAFFTLTVEGRRREWKAEADLMVKDGAAVQVLDVIDGDELAVRSGNDVFTVRLLGIKAFGRKANDPAVSGAGLAAEQALRDAAQGKLTVSFDEYKLDKNRRLLAYLMADGDDVGLKMVQQGMALAYIRYPFSREDSYLSAESRARTTRVGLWGNPKAAVRANALSAAWKVQRDDD